MLKAIAQVLNNRRETAMHYILTKQDNLPRFQKKGGGKAGNLAKMEAIQVHVPDWFCLSTDAFDRFVDDNGLHDHLTATADLAAFETDVEALFLSHELPRAIEAELIEALHAFDMENAFVAVRSSGMDEDSADHSFAGQFSSFLYQRGLENISRSIRKCWASGFSERALAYRQHKGLPANAIKVAVIVQLMVDAQTSGVAFSRNPMHVMDRSHVVIDAVYGLGEGLVSGRLEADHYEVHRETLWVDRVLVAKEELFSRAVEGGIELVPVAADLQQRSSLTDAQAREVATLCIQLEDHLGLPQDCEWAYDRAGKLHALQTRPITNLPPASYFDPRINGQEPTLWDNSNIIESYSGVTTPLTFSFASNAYQQVYVQFCEIMGVPQSVIETHESMYRNMLGLIRGRIYYNLINWYRLIQMLPGAGSSASFMETMMGVRQQLKPEQMHLFEFMKHPPEYTVFRKVKVLGMTLWRFFRMPRIVEAFNLRFEVVYNLSSALDFSAMSLPALMHHYQYLHEELLKKWHAPIINDYLCMIFFGLLKKYTAKWVADESTSASLQNDLLCGEGNLESTEPTKMLMRIAAHIDEEGGALRQWIAHSKTADIQHALFHTDRAPALKRMMENFLEQYGFRCMNELKLEENDLHDDPGFAINVIAGYVRTRSFDIKAMERREKEIRAQAERVVDERLSGGWWVKKVVYKWILKHTRRAVRSRENLRFARTRIFGVARHLFRGAGHQLVKLGQLADASDVFYLTVDELVSYCEGRPVTTDLAGLVTLRKQEFEGYRNAPPPPDRFLTYGAAGVAITAPQMLADADLLQSEPAAPTDPDVLMGTPCCPGIAEGVVRVAHNAQDAEGLDREILVASRTDPGWVPLFPSCAGLLIERGSLLSHSAVVARELGLPTIVGISGGLLEKLATGQRVRMDAGKGEVRVLS